jgi:hypothetical protein
MAGDPAPPGSGDLPASVEGSDITFAGESADSGLAVAALVSALDHGLLQIAFRNHRVRARVREITGTR